jgi:hypothetical protein
MKFVYLIGFIIGLFSKELGYKFMYFFAQKHFIKNFLLENEKKIKSIISEDSVLSPIHIALYIVTVEAGVKTLDMPVDIYKWKLKACLNS